MTQSSSNLLRIFVYMISGSRWIMVGLESRCRSLGQILVIACQHFSCFSFDPIFLQLSQNVCLDLGHVRSLFRSGQKVGHLVKSQKNLVYTLGATFLVQSSSNLPRMLVLVIFLVKYDHGLGGVKVQVTRSNLRKILFTFQGQHFFPNLPQTCSECKSW